MLQTQIIRFESLPSTNLEAARRAAEGAPEGLCIIAGEQTAGRGRLERNWFSPKSAGLYFSIILRPEFDQIRWPLLTLMAAVAVHDALKEVYGLEMDIKWPNDIIVNDKKLCGILAETVETPEGRAVVLGIGINLEKISLPVELEQIATSVEAAGGQKVELDVLIEPLIRLLRAYYQNLQQAGGSEAIISEWSKRSTYASGKQVRVVDGDAIIEGISCGLESDGALMIKLAKGELKIVRTGDVTNLRISDTQGSNALRRGEQT